MDALFCCSFGLRKVLGFFFQIFGNPSGDVYRPDSRVDLFLLNAEAEVDGSFLFLLPVLTSLVSSIERSIVLFEVYFFVMCPFFFCCLHGGVFFSKMFGFF